MLWVQRLFDISKVAVVETPAWPQRGAAIHLHPDCFRGHDHLSLIPTENHKALEESHSVRDAAVCFVSYFSRQFCSSHSSLCPDEVCLITQAPNILKHCRGWKQIFAAMLLELCLIRNSTNAKSTFSEWKSKCKRLIFTIRKKHQLIQTEYTFFSRSALISNYLD